MLICLIKMYCQTLKLKRGFTKTYRILSNRSLHTDFPFSQMHIFIQAVLITHNCRYFIMTSYCTLYGHNLYDIMCHEQRGVLQWP